MKLSSCLALLAALPLGCGGATAAPGEPAPVVVISTPPGPTSVASAAPVVGGASRAVAEDEDEEPDSGWLITGSVARGTWSNAGRVPPEIVQRIVRQNDGLFRLCYENGLRTNPRLAGTVRVRFVIEQDGTVVKASPTRASEPTTEVAIDDPSVKSCVVSAFRGLSFPAPEGGNGKMKVVYPIVFPLRPVPSSAPQQP